MNNRLSSATQLIKIEIILNNNLPSNKQYVKYNQFDVPDPDTNNYGNLNIGSGENYILMMYDNFDRISGYAQCTYYEQLDPKDIRKCIKCPDGTYSLDGQANKCYPCSKSNS
jgi:hypothetical protein